MDMVGKGSYKCGICRMSPASILIKWHKIDALLSWDIVKVIVCISTELKEEQSFSQKGFYVCFAHVWMGYSFDSSDSESTWLSVKHWRLP
jgi:hypothetical protein